MGTGQTARGEPGTARTRPVPGSAALAADPRISALVAEQDFRPEALIEVLHRLQALDGYLAKTSLRQVAQELGLPLSRVYGVASFYHLFRLEPPCPHRCAVCLGSACFVLGASSLAARLEARLGLRLERPSGSATGAPRAPGPARAGPGAGQASALEGPQPQAPIDADVCRRQPRNQDPVSPAPLSPKALSQEAWSLEPVSCLGACGQAPVLVVDGVLALRLPIASASALEARLDRLGLPRAPGPLAPGGR